MHLLPCQTAEDPNCLIFKHGHQESPESARGANNSCASHERLNSLPAVEPDLLAGIELAQLDRQAYAVSDNEEARQLHEVRDELFWELPQEGVAAA